MKKLRKTNSLLFIIFMTCITFIFIKNHIFFTKESINTSSTSNAELSFAVLGDIHENTSKLKECIKELNKINPKMDAWIFNGDTVDQGIKSQYSSVEKLLKSNKSLLPKTLIRNIGNHEFFDYTKEYNSDKDVNDFLNRYYKFSSENKVYHDKWINGYHFISLGSETGNTKELGSTKAFISEIQRDWLKTKLNENYEKGKPIFVFLHQHISSIMQGWIGVENGEELTKILAQYPEIVIFTSHTHISPEINNITRNQPFTTIHTGAVHYTIMPDGKGGRTNIMDASYGLYVEVNKNKINVKVRDFKNKIWIISEDI